MQPAGSGGTTKRATSSQIGNTANIGTVGLGITSLPQLNIANSTLDFLAILHDNGLWKISPSGLSLVTGNMPAGGTVSQFLIKNSSTNYDTVWATMTGDVSMNGTSTFTATVATAAVSYAKFQQVGALSVLGVSTNATAIIDAISGSANQVLRVNNAGTGLHFGQVNLSSTSAITGFLTTAYFSGTLAVPGGGTGTTTITAFGLVAGNGTSAVQIVPAGTAGQLLIAQGTASLAAFASATGDVTISSVGTATIATNAVTYAKFQQMVALSVHANSSSAVANSTAVAATAANQVLVVNPGGTALAFGQVNLSSTSAITGTLNATSYLAGIVSVGLGGTGQTSFIATGILYGNGTGAIQAVATGVVNSVLIANASSIGWGQVNLSSTSAVTGALSILSSAQIMSATAVPAGGTTGAGYKLFATTNLGIFAGSGAPSLLAATGSIYLRTDGNTTTSRMYVNTNGSATWTPFVSNT